MSNKPSFIAYAVRQRAEGEKANWTAIGVAWAHKKGGGFNVELEAAGRPHRPDAAEGRRRLRQRLRLRPAATVSARRPALWSGASSRLSFRLLRVTARHQAS